MKLPKLLRSRNRIRDYQIISDYVENKVSREELAKRYHVTPTRISQILMLNASSIVNSIKDYSKLQRINLLEKALSSEDIPFARNKTDIIDALRKEMESDKQFLNDNRSVIQVFLPGKDNTINAIETAIPSSKPLDVVENRNSSINTNEQGLQT